MQHLRDAALLIGIGLVAYGSWMLHPAAGFIVGGLSLIGLRVVGVSR